jgi:hypothetical protein
MTEPNAKSAATAMIAEVDRTIAEAVALVQAAKREKRRSKRLRRESNKIERSLAGNKPDI